MSTLRNIVGRVGGGDGTHCLRPISHSVIHFQVTGAVPIGIRKKLAGGDLELAESAVEMGVHVTGAWTVWGG